MLVLKERLLELQEKLAAREKGEVERKHAVKYRKVGGFWECLGWCWLASLGWVLGGWGDRSVHRPSDPTRTARTD